MNYELSHMIITDNADLLHYIPNVLREVKGETPLFEKMSPFLEAAERWLAKTILAEDMLPGNETYAAPVVVAEAYRLALPQLDVVLTPNGFATVGNQNLAPASKMRVDRLVGSLADIRDRGIETLVERLTASASWRSSEQGRFFRAILFPPFAICRQLGFNSGLWDKYIELRPKVIELELSLAEEWLSPELMEELRRVNLTAEMTAALSELIQQVQAQIVRCLRDGSFSARPLADIVNRIRNSPVDFPQWHSSVTAQLFEPPVFRNKRNAPGYFF